jgi:hypothetical protein
VDASRPAGEWQTLDIVFQQARRDGSGNITAKPRVTVKVNGVTVLLDKEIPVPTRTKMPSPEEGKPGPLILQKQVGSGCLFRNIRVRPLGNPAGATAAEISADGFIELFNGRGLLGNWHTESGNRTTWRVVNGELTNEGAQEDILSNQSFTDCELHLEFNISKNSNSGVFLQDLYEVQIADGPGLNYTPDMMTGCVYKEITPTKNADKGPDTWQKLEIVFQQARRDANDNLTAKARITVKLNSVTVIENQEIAKPSGEFTPTQIKERQALEGRPGLLRLQKHVGSGCLFRNIRIRPLATAPFSPARL